MGNKRRHSTSTSAAAEDGVPDAHAAETEALTDIHFPKDSSWEAMDRHYAQLYSRAPDFKELARLNPEFKAVTKGRELDFNDPKSVMQLTKTLLKLDFGLEIELVDDRLCPPVANRHNYILWLKALTDTTSYDKPPRSLAGLDIGTGASCIYPLLGATQRPWSFIATDIDDKSLACARRNVALNGLEGRISLLKRDPGEKLIPDEAVAAPATFVMTNPPFYCDEAAMLRGAGEKKRPPFSACTGSATEMVTEGGEVAFVERILAESLVLRDRIQWYTAMLGFLSSVSSIVGKLREHGINNYAVTEFVQGNKTRRWAVGWSFAPLRPEMSVARGLRSQAGRSMLPAPSEATVVKLPRPPLPSSSIGAFADRFATVVGELEVAGWTWDRERMEGSGRAADRVWGRAWRRRRQREMKTGVEEKWHDNEGKDSGQEGKERAMFGFKAWIRVGEAVSVGCRWVEGYDLAEFESFQGYLKTTAETAYAAAVGDK